jgi:hypothetical protein
MHGLATARQRVGALLALALLLGGCGAAPTPGPPVTTTFLPAAKPVPTQAGGPISTAPPARVGTAQPANPPPVPSGVVRPLGTPLPSPTPPPPRATLPPPGPTPGPDAFAAWLTCPAPLAVAAFQALIQASGVQLQYVVVSGAAPDGGAGLMWGQNSGQILRNLDQGGGAWLVAAASVTLDHAQYTRLQADGRVALTPGSAVPPAGDLVATLARWQAAFAAVVTVHGHQEALPVRADGTPAGSDAGQGTPLTSDELYEMHTLDMTARYRFTAHQPAGDVTTLWDGTHAYRYWAARHEVYRPQPENVNTYWSDDIDDHTLYVYLRPTQALYKLVGPRRLDGREVIKLLVVKGNFAPQGLTGTQIFLDTATYLPYRVVIHPSDNIPAGQATGGLQRTFSPLEINGPVTAADFAADFPPDTVTVYEQAYMGPRLAEYPDLRTAAQAADFPLYAPPSLTGSTIYAQYFVEIEGRRSPVIALNNGAILEGRYLPVQDLEIAADATATPQSMTLDGQPATLDHGVLTFTRGLTHIRISGVPSAEQAASVVQQLQLVP